VQPLRLRTVGSVCLEFVCRLVFGVRLKIQGAQNFRMTRTSKAYGVRLEIQGPQELDETAIQ
jgi:hypothetical protein